MNLERNHSWEFDGRTFIRPSQISPLVRLIGVPTIGLPAVITYVIALKIHLLIYISIDALYIHMYLVSSPDPSVGGCRPEGSGTRLTCTMVCRWMCALTVTICSIQSRQQQTTSHHTCTSNHMHTTPHHITCTHHIVSHLHIQYNSPNMPAEIQLQRRTQFERTADRCNPRQIPPPTR